MSEEIKLSIDISLPSKAEKIDENNDLSDKREKFSQQFLEVFESQKVFEKEEKENVSLPQKAGRGIELPLNNLEMIMLESGTSLIVEGPEPTNESIKAFALKQNIDIDSFTDFNSEKKQVGEPDLSANQVGEKLSGDFDNEILENNPVAFFATNEIVAKLVVEDKHSQLGASRTRESIIGRSAAENISQKTTYKLSDQHTLGTHSSNIAALSNLDNRATKKSHNFSKEENLTVFNTETISKLPNNLRPSTHHQMISKVGAVIDNNPKNLQDSVSLKTSMIEGKGSARLQNKFEVDLVARVIFSKKASRQLGKNFLQVGENERPLARGKIELNEFFGNSIKNHDLTEKVGAHSHRAMISQPEVEHYNRAFLANSETVSTGESQSFDTTEEMELALGSSRRFSNLEALTKKFSGILASRLLTQISRGVWRVEMDLHPKSLGRIEVQIDYSNGQLEAQFNTSQPTTREILLESLPRLKEVLAENGMNPASINVELGNKKESDEKQTEKFDEEGDDGRNPVQKSADMSKSKGPGNINGQYEFFV